MHFKGGCHCGNIGMAFTTALSPGDMVVRACQCDFCRKHNTLAVADANGSLKIRVHAVDEVNKYRFGLETAEYLICRRCGVYVAAVTLDAPPRGLVIVNALDDHAQFTSQPTATSYDHETNDDRRARRTQTWTPVTIE